MTSHQKVLGNALAQFLGRALTAITSFVIVKLVTSVGAEFYGNYVTAYEFLAFFGILADAGLFAIAVREMARARERSEQILGNIFSLRLILIVAVVLIAGVSAQLVPNYAPYVRTGIWITALSMALTIVAGTLSSVLQARMKIQKFAGSLVAGKILLAALVFFIIRNFEFFGTPVHGFFALLWAGVISNVLFAILVSFFAAREVPIRLHWDTVFLKRILRDSLPYGLALILQTLYLRLDVVLISILLGAKAVGIYGVPTRILESFLVLGVFFGQAILPRISEQEKDADAMNRTLAWGMEKLLLFSLPIVIGISAFAKEIVLLLSSPEFLSAEGFLGSNGVLQILIFTIFFAFFNQLFTFTLVAKNRQNYLLLVNGIALGMNAVLNILFLESFGLIAAVLSTIGCEIVVFALLVREIKKHFSPKFSSKNLTMILLANALISAEIFLTPVGKNLFWAIGICGATYLAMLWPIRKRLM